MEHLALYREWRPQFFRDVVGQDHVCRTLLNAVRLKAIAHAYLFCGPRGTGKTSTARILAKALNCSSNEDGEPCNQCNQCSSFTAQKHLDCIEIDAASHRGVEEIRDLRQKVGFAPVSAKFKFYIIDEVHMLTGEAFSALLKTLEEPPRHTVFVLATTESHKVPPTVLSRCQRFDFRRLGREIISAHLAKVARSKGWEIDSDALDLLSLQAGGALRDALGMLDQAASFARNRITRAHVEALTGSLEEDVLASLLRASVEGDVANLLMSLESVFAQGFEARQVLYQLADYIRGYLFVPGVFKQKKRQLIDLLRSLAAAEGDMKGSSRPDLILELALLRVSSAQQAEFQTNISKREAAYQKARCSEPQEGPQHEGDQEDLQELHKQILKALTGPSLLTQFLPKCKFHLEDKRMIITAPSIFSYKLLQKEENQRLLRQALKSLGFQSFILEIACSVESPENPMRARKPLLGGENGSHANETGEKDAALNAAGSEGDLVGAALSVFKGEVISLAEAEGE